MNNYGRRQLNIMMLITVSDMHVLFNHLKQNFKNQPIVEMRIGAQFMLYASALPVGIWLNLTAIRLLKQL